MCVCMCTCVCVCVEYQLGFSGFKQQTPILTKLSNCVFIGMLFGYHRTMLGNRLTSRYLKEVRKQKLYKWSLRKTHLGSALQLECIYSCRVCLFVILPQDFI